VTQRQRKTGPLTRREHSQLMRLLKRTPRWAELQPWAESLRPARKQRFPIDDYLLERLELWCKLHSLNDVRPFTAIKDQLQALYDKHGHKFFIDKIGSADRTSHRSVVESASRRLYLKLKARKTRPLRELMRRAEENYADINRVAGIELFTARRM
jgi:hypothetical protein